MRFIYNEGSLEIFGSLSEKTTYFLLDFKSNIFRFENKNLRCLRFMAAKTQAHRRIAK